MPFTVQDLTYAKDALEGISHKADKSKAAATYSEYRALKLEETFNADGQILHELYFAHLGGHGGKPSGALLAQIEHDFGSFEEFVADVSACGMASRGWATVAYDPTDGKIHSFLGDAHNHGGVWGAVPLMAEYIKAFWKNIDWSVVEKAFAQVKH
ncbi:MAG: superoxide dismutase [Chloroflexi bacterium]|nr:superoxide dismutase [Chloroflexota bacterium]